MNNGSSAAYDFDILQFLGDLENFSLGRSDNHLLIAENSTENASENKVIVNNFFRNNGDSSYAIDEIMFNAGVEINLSEILQLFKSDAQEENIDGYSYSKTEDDKGNVIAVNFEIL